MAKVSTPVRGSTASLFLGFFLATAPIADAADCRSISNTTDRLKCYDSQSDKKADPAGKLSITEPIEVRIVDTADLFVSPRKYQNKEIGLKSVRCYFADANDYRCSVSGGTLLTIFTKFINPPAAKEFVEKNCDTLKKLAAGRTCLMNIRFRYGEDEYGQDLVSGYEKRAIIRPKDGVSIIFEHDIVRRRPR